MTTTSPTTASSSARVAVFAYGVGCYAFFLVVFLYAVAFVERASITIGGTELTPRTIDHGGPTGSAAAAVVADVLLLSLFAVQHSVMARQGFKRWWTRFVPTPMERSTFVLAASACLALLEWAWRPLPHQLWAVDPTPLRAALTTLSVFGFVLVLASTFLINHFDLFGLRQVTASLQGRTLPPQRMVAPLWYGLVRHPIYLGFVIAFWATPTMSVGHLLFAAATTGYILVGIQLEERDLVRQFGDDYRSYRRRVPMLVPGARRRG